MLGPVQIDGRKFDDDDDNKKNVIPSQKVSLAFGCNPSSHVNVLTCYIDEWDIHILHSPSSRWYQTGRQFCVGCRQSCDVAGVKNLLFGHFFR